MITLTAEMRITGIPISPFIIGASKLGYGDRFKKISTDGGTPFKIGESILGDGSVFFVETIEYQEEEIVKIDRRSIVSLESEVKDRADIDKPSFGIISTGGSLSFKDSSSRFLNYANAGLLTEGIEIKIFLENTVKKTKKQVGLYYTTDWDYDNDNRSVSVSFKDDLEEWQDIQDVGMELENGVNANRIYEYLVEKTPKKFDIKVSRINKAYFSRFPYFNNGSLWSQWNKFCEITQSCIYKNEKNEVIISNAFDN